MQGSVISLVGLSLVLYALKIIFVIYLFFFASMKTTTDTVTLNSPQQSQEYKLQTMQDCLTAL
jgi:hypothetical protein